MFRTQKGSLLQKMLIPMVAVLVFQACLFFSTVFFGGTVETLNQNAFELLRERVAGRKNYLENEMIQRWSSVEESVVYMNQLMPDLAAAPDEEAKAEVMTQMADQLVYLLRRNSVTGTFIVFGSAETAGSAPALYIRDLDPDAVPGDNSDLLLECAPSLVTKKLGITMDSWWKPQLTLDPSSENDAYFYNPLRAAAQHPDFDFKDLGYWSQPHRIDQKDMEVFTYTVPLIADNGEVFGVLGVEISADYLRRHMPYPELFAEQKGAYFLGVDHAGDLDFEVVFSSGPAFTQIYQDGDRISFEPLDQRAGCFRTVDGARGGDAVYGSVQYLKLYNTNTPFSEEHWALVGFVRGSDLLAESNRVKSLICFSMVISLTLGLIAVILLSRVFTRPISILVDRLLSSDPQKPVQLGRVRITEIDELSMAIEQLSSDVADFASKLSQIIEMTGMSVGAFEFRRDSRRVLITGSLYDILDIAAPSKSGENVTLELFVERIRKLEEHLEHSSEDGKMRIYRFAPRAGAQNWVRMRIYEDESKILGVVVDITQEILEKRKLEYERDYDLLTNLLNRRAFHEQVKGILLGGSSVRVAAMLMIDLDNLKYINDTYGHDYGDLYICCAARALKIFTPRGAVVSRMSGDEFLVFLYGYEVKEQARALIGEIRAEMEAAFLTLPSGERFRLRSSMGVAWYPDDAQTQDMLIHYADFAMYKVKNTTKGGSREFSIESYQKESYLLSGKEELNKLIDGGLVEYFFQPIVGVRDGSIYAYEALMRTHSESLKSPMEVLALARSQSKLYQIERLTWFTAMENYVRCHALFGGAKVFINSIPNQVLTSEDLAEFERLFQPMLDQIVIELTEEEKPDESSTRFKQEVARRWNCQIALDDYGTGYNGEAVLLSLTPAFVKVDMSIVRGIDSDENRQRILQNLVSYARPQNIRVIVEGVETPAELETVILCGVDYLQGFYLGIPTGRPQSIDQDVREQILQARLLYMNNQLPNRLQDPIFVANRQQTETGKGEM